MNQSYTYIYIYIKNLENMFAKHWNIDLSVLTEIFVPTQHQRRSCKNINQAFNLYIEK